ncbi:MAG: chemotaxis protein MotA [Alphaproteobacteria bacterium]|jgi:chemotaxis protein MotA
MAKIQASAAIGPEFSGSVVRGRTRIDTATIIGLVIGFGLISTAIVLGGAPLAFFDAPAVLIVIGGTFAVTMICFSLGDLARLPTILLKTLFHSIPDASKTALHMLRLSEMARKRGILELDQLLGDMQYEPFMNKAIGLAVDGTPIEEIRTVLQCEIDRMAERHYRSANMLRKAAEIAPAMGLIGTLIGLVQMLGNLSDPNSIGPGLAVALLTTFYGAVLANMVFAPLASKLERNTSDEILVANICMMAAESICRKENPRRTEVLLNALLPPARRIRYFS